jgi:DNA-directed RNA polymerase specialized sigma24 family protein
MGKETKQSEAYLKAYDEYADAIYRYCLFRVFNEEKAKDLTQDTFLRTWEYLASGRRDSEQFLKILQELDEPTRLCLTLRYVEDLEPREIAEITGESANTVSVRIHRGIKKLKILMEHE